MRIELKRLNANREYAKQARVHGEWIRKIDLLSPTLLEITFRDRNLPGA